MKKFLLIPVLLIIIACNTGKSDSGKPVITVSISPFSYFVREIAGDDFIVNVMIPAGVNPHFYEPYPDQISSLKRSVAYISNGYMGFEMAWLERFYKMNENMRKLTLGELIEPIETGHNHDGDSDHTGAVDPHFWVSPKSAMAIALSVKDLLCDINPGNSEVYEMNYNDLIRKISELDRRAEHLFSDLKGMRFMIYHPNLAYLARDYGLIEIAVEFEGKEPSPSRLKELVDIAVKENISMIFVQKEFDVRNAKTISDETGAEIKIIDPLSEDWLASTNDIINGLYNSAVKNRK